MTNFYEIEAKLNESIKTVANEVIKNFSTDPNDPIECIESKLYISIIRPSDLQNLYGDFIPFDIRFYFRGNGISNKEKEITNYAKRSLEKFGIYVQQTEHNSSIDELDIKLFACL